MGSGKAGRVLGVGGPRPGVEGVPTLAVAAALIEDSDFVLMLSPGLVADERIVSATIAAMPAIATFPDKGVERVDADAGNVGPMDAGTECQVGQNSQFLRATPAAAVHLGIYPGIARARPPLAGDG